MPRKYIPPADGMKRCSCCAVRKPLDAFALVQGGPRRNSWCRPCRAAKQAVFRTGATSRDTLEIAAPKFWARVKKSAEEPKA